MKKSIAILLAAMMVCSVLAGCGGSSDTNTPTTAPTTAPVTDNPAYTEIFTNNFIVDAPALFLMLDSASFATETNSLIEKMEFGYKDDIIHEMINTIYYPVADLPEEEKATLDTTMKEACAEYIALDFCTVSSNMGNAYYQIKLTFTGLDDADHVLALQELGLIEGDESSGLCSMSQTEATLLAQGYIKK